MTDETRFAVGDVWIERASLRRVRIQGRTDHNEIGYRQILADGSLETSCRRLRPDTFEALFLEEKTATQVALAQCAVDIIDSEFTWGGGGAEILTFLDTLQKQPPDGSLNEAQREGLKNIVMHGRAMHAAYRIVFKRVLPPKGTDR